jgi:hypothetical protein
MLIICWGLRKLIFNFTNYTAVPVWALRYGTVRVVDEFADSSRPSDTE